MKCPECQFDNREGAKFCSECGLKFELSCPECGTSIRAHSKFCDECGCALESPLETFDDVSDIESPPIQPSDRIRAEDVAPTVGERKHVTVLFSDLSGYTTMSERLDPEEVKEITSRIFGEISKIVSKYEGFVEKFVGDAVMAIFGIPKAHEDDPIRAIRATIEIHGLVDSLSPELEKRIGKPISMHSGINSGLVITGEVDMKRGTHGVAGDTINLASRLGSLAQAGELLVSDDTYHLAEGHYAFESLEPTLVKGKTEPVEVHKVLSAKERPITVRRLSGLRADLIGRRVELAQLGAAIEQLREGKGRIFSICGDAGTGKSRLIEEFKSTCDLEEIQWLEGHAYAYSQNIPYFPMIDLLNRTFQIEEGDSPEKVRQKVESGVENLVENKEDVIPYVGSLYSLSYPEIEEVSPELWKSRLRDAAGRLLSALARRAPTIFLLEDLHWADPAFIEFLRHTLLEIRQPAIVLCVYRPDFSLFTTHQAGSIAMVYREIRIQDLSPSEAQDMLESILKSDYIPDDLRRFVQNKAEGNPFYLEELVNSLIETETLIRENGSWKVTRPITETDLSTTIHGVISGRIDRLERDTKRILQEASVIGRAFLYEILKRITEFKQDVDRFLRGLEQLDIIRTRSLQPDLEYVFKHALTQEVVYSGLLKKERKEIHERIALVMEQIFHDRLPEFYETLAFHFAQGQSVIKAVDYLAKSGEKSLARYAVEEAHQYFKEAFNILASKTEKSETEKVALIDILNSWGSAYYYLGDIKGFMNLFESQKEVAESLGDKARLGMFYAWFGIALWMGGKTKDSYEYLRNALELGENSDNQKVVGYACTWLTWTCAELGLFDEGIGFGERAQKIAESFPSDQYLFFKSLAGLCYINWIKGDTKRVFEGAELLLEYGERNSNSRSKVFGHWINGFGHYLNGDMKASQKNSEKACEVALDPFYSQFPKITVGMAHLLGGQLQEAKDVLQSLLKFSEKCGMGQTLEIAHIFFAPTLIGIGHMKQGLGILEKTQLALIRNERVVWYCISEYILGQVYSQIATGPKPAISIMAQNVGFLVKNIPFASKKAEVHFNKAIQLAKKIGAKGFLGTIYLDIGLFYKARKRSDQAREFILKAIQVFEECEAEVYLAQANEAFESLG